MNAKKLKELKKQANLALAKKDFFHYCHVMAPDFYKYNRKYLVDMANTMQNFYESEEDDILIINIPPRTGKSRTATMFAQWIFGKNPNEKIMTGSYNETLSTMFAKGVRNAIAEQKADENKVVYSDIFPNTRIKHGDASMSLWSLEGGYNNYLATSPGGTATGFGATCFVAGTKVWTKGGDKNIECVKPGDFVYSMDEDNYRVELKEVVATKISKKIKTVVIKTALGVNIECTEDHPIYVYDYEDEKRKYVEASKIKEHHSLNYAGFFIDNVLSIEEKAYKEVEVYDIQVKDNENFFANGILVHNCLIIDDLIKNAKEAFNARVLEEQFSWFCFTGETLVKTKSGEKMIKDVTVGDKLLTFNHSKRIIEEKSVVRVGNKLSNTYRLEFEDGREIECTGNHQFYTTKGYKSIEEILCDMRRSIEQGETLLFEGLQRKNNIGYWEKDGVHDLQERNTSRKEEQTEQILFYRLQKQEESRRSRRSIRWVGKVKGRTKERIQRMQEVWRKEKSTCTSYRPRFKKQRIEKSSGTMPILPLALSQVTRLPQDDIRRVYDIELKDNHNFFANGMLVHNCNTMLSRLEEGGKIIVIMTRWSSKDLAGRLLEYFAEEGKKVVHINMKAMQDDGTMLCEEVLSKESYLMKTKAMSHEIAMANYQQEPIDVKGRLYTTLKTYSGELPRFKEIKNVTDTADTGADYLCSINYGVTFDDEAYILDVLYTQEGMEVTEPKHAKMLFEGNVNVSDIESNNGGRGYARNVERILKTTYGTNRVVIKPFHQSGNKESRILSTSSWVMEHVYFPEGWRNKWPDFYKSMMEYQKNGKNAHDDAQDALALLAEKINSKPKFESW